MMKMLAQQTHDGIESVTNSENCALIALDPGMLIIDCNDKAKEIFSVFNKTGSLIGAHIRQLYTMPSLLICLREKRSLRAKPILAGSKKYLVDIWHTKDEGQKPTVIISFYQNEEGAKESQWIGNGLERVTGYSPAMEKLKLSIAKLGPTSTNVLIKGQPGTGRQGVAQALHNYSNQPLGVFLKLHCATVPSSVWEKDLLEYFKRNCLPKDPLATEQVSQGTLFLEELNQLSIESQQKLLSLLRNLDSDLFVLTDKLKLKLRVLASASADLGELMDKGEFLAELYSYLNMAVLETPTLKERQEDILPLATQFIKEYNTHLGTRVEGMAKPVVRLLQGYSWPGNIRELKNVIERATQLAKMHYIQVDHLPRYLLSKDYKVDSSMSHTSPIESNSDFAQLLGRQTLFEIVDKIEKQVIEQALALCNGNKAHTAHMLGISRPGLYKKLAKHSLEEEEHA